MTLTRMDQNTIYKALVSPVRRDILHRLKSPELWITDPIASAETGLSVSEICDLLQMAQSSVSAHLAVLAEAGLVSSKTVGQWHFFRRNEETIDRFISKMVKTL